MQAAELMAVGAAAGLGGAAGTGIRLMLARLRRGVVVPIGRLESAGALVAALTTTLAWGRPTIGLVLLAGWLLVALSGVDIVHHRLPDAITVPALPIAAAAVGVTYLLAPTSGSPLRAAASAAVLWAVFAAMARVSSSWMGRGDVKLIPTLGLLMGYGSAAAVLLGLLVAFALGSVVALAGMALGRLTPRSAIPMGPHLLIGCWVVLLLPA